MPFITILTLYLFAILAAIASSASVSPSWITNPNINAGEVVAVNSQVSSTWLTPTTSISKFQNYNQNGFTSTPRVIVTMIGYGQSQPAIATQHLGFSFTITNINKTSFDYTIVSLDLTTIMLHYNYIAIQQQLTTFHLQFRTLTFDNSFNVSNPSAVQKYDQVILTNPQNNTNTNYLTQDIRIQAYPVGFNLLVGGTNSSFGINATVFNSTHYTLKVYTAPNNNLSSITFSVISFNRDALNANHLIYLDIILSQVVGNVSTNLGASLTNQTYKYRNGVSGAISVQFQLNGSQIAPNYFYYSVSSTNNNYILFQGFNHRVRQCPSTHTYYQPSTLLCHDICPSALTPTANLICLLCHLSCSNCSSASNSSACTACSSSVLRQLNGTVCNCMVGYFQNSSGLCEACSSVCLTCSSVSICTSCNSSLNLIINNSTCTCNTGFYSNSTCQNCSLYTSGCLSCSYNTPTSQFTCFNCDSSIGLTLSADNLSCIANPNPTAPCGNGILQTGQECDDSNIVNSDGCSSGCIIETDHSCFINTTIASHSICYYNRPIELSIKKILKIPGENKVQLKILINAPNCNPTTLKQYLQTTNYLQLYDNPQRMLSARLLQNAWMSIPTKTISFDNSNQILTITFNYNSSIDLSNKYIQLGASSSSTTSTNQYFYSSPTATLQLSKPFNNLQTNYYSSEELSLVSTLIILNMVLVTAFWIFIVLALIFKKGAVAAECMLVLQLSYLLLLTQPWVLEGKSGMQKVGKYSSGYGYPFLPEQYLAGLSALNLDSNSINSFNTTVALMIILFALMIVLIILRYCKDSQSRLSLQIEENISQRVTNSQRQYNNQNKILKPVCASDKVLSYLADILLTLAFISIAPITVVICFTSSSTLIPNVVLGITYLLVVSALWTIYLKNRSQWHFTNISFSSIIQQKQDNSFKTFVPKYYYLILFIFLVLLSILISFTRTIGIVPLGVVLGISLVMIIVIAKMDIYPHRLDKIRSIGNIVALIAISSMAIVNYYLHSSLGIGRLLCILELVLLFLVLIGNLIVAIITQYQIRQLQKRANSKSSSTQIKQIMNQLGISHQLYNSSKYNRQPPSNIGSLIEENQFSSSVSSKQRQENHAKIAERISELKIFKRNLIQGIKIQNLIEFESAQFDKAMQDQVEMSQVQEQVKVAKELKEIQQIFPGRASVGLNHMTKTPFTNHKEPPPTADYFQED